MGVINSELARSIHLNGRRKDGNGAWAASINPGLNTIPDDIIPDLRLNGNFREHVDRSEMNEVRSQPDVSKPSEPIEDLNDLDITTFNVKNGRDVIASADLSHVDLLKKWETQENKSEKRKGIFQAIDAQREILANLSKPKEN